MSSFIDISIPYEKQKLEQSAEIYTLRWEHQNTHIINQTERMTNQSLQIHLKPITVLPVGFVIKLTARYVSLSDGSYVPQFVYASEILALVKRLSITDNYSF